MKSILDQSFRYTPAAETDIRKTFRRVRRQMEIERAREQVQRDLDAQRVVPMKRPAQ